MAFRRSRRVRPLCIPLSARRQKPDRVYAWELIAFLRIFRYPASVMFVGDWSVRTIVCVYF